MKTSLPIIKKNQELLRKIVLVRKPTKTFVAGYNAGLQQAFKSKIIQKPNVHLSKDQ
jgi:hypothetical protein